MRASGALTRPCVNRGFFAGSSSTPFNCLSKIVKKRIFRRTDVLSRLPFTSGSANKDIRAKRNKKMLVLKYHTQSQQVMGPVDAIISSACICIIELFERRTTTQNRIDTCQIKQKHFGNKNRPNEEQRSQRVISKNSVVFFACISSRAEALTIPAPHCEDRPASWTAARVLIGPSDPIAITTKKQQQTTRCSTSSACIPCSGGSPRLPLRRDFFAEIDYTPARFFCRKIACKNRAGSRCTYMNRFRPILRSIVFRHRGNWRFYAFEGGWNYGRMRNSLRKVGLIIVTCHIKMRLYGQPAHRLLLPQIHFNDGNECSSTRHWSIWWELVAFFCI